MSFYYVLSKHINVLGIYSSMVKATEEAEKVMTYEICKYELKRNDQNVRCWVSNSNGSDICIQRFKLNE